jgi:MoaA/NifB/PqqE/SkfB family radical SAM enzyme
MLTRKMTPWRKCKAVLKYIKITAQRRPRLVNLEVTKFCNASCDFCDYWRVKESPRLDDYAGIIRKINPMMVTLTGGEPLLRKDLPEVIRKLREGFGFLYIGMVTHGQLLTLEKAKALWDAGLDQLSISMNYLGPRHDEERGLPGLFDHLSKLIPRLKDVGVDNVVLNTVIQDGNLDHVADLIRQAHEWGIRISFSAYTSLKNGNERHMVRPERQERLRAVIEEIRVLKRRYRNVVSSGYYLSVIPRYFERGSVEGCRAGRSFVQVTPDGYLKVCSEMPVYGHGSEYRPRREGVDCTKCWFSCRGESQAPLTPGRLWELVTG